MPRDSQSPAAWEARRCLRFWAICDVVYAVGLAAALVCFVPWKWPLAHVLLLAYFAAHLISAPGLWQLKRWGWRCALITAFVGWAFAVVGVAGLLASWAYLKAVYGSFGKGASLVSLLLATTVFQALGLYPALRLRSLLRRNVREQMRGGRFTTAGVGLVLLMCAALPAGLYNHHRMVQAEAAPAATAQAAVRWLRASEKAGMQELQAPLPHAPLIASFYRDGKVVARAQGYGRTWQEALGEIQAKLAGQHLDPNLGGRWKLDRPLGFAPVLGWPPFAEALGFQPGSDGLRIRGDASRMLLPDDMIAADVYGSSPLLPFLAEVTLGVSPTWIREQLAAEPHQQLERFATESWIECGAEDRRICRVQRGVVELPPTTNIAAAVAAGAFMLRHQKPDGTFTYVYRPWQNLDEAAGYNFARHAGTAYTLALLAPLAPDLPLAEGSSRALQWLLARAGPVCDGRFCVQEGSLAKVGNNALSLLALLTYQQNTGDDRWAEKSSQVARFLVSLQRTSGDLVPAFLVDEQRAAAEMPAQMFASEEAAFALAKAGRVLGEPRYVEAAAALVNFLTKKKYAHFLGRFTYGADSWTCMAAAELPKPLVQAQWVDFCLGYADFLRRMQFQPTEHDPAFAGHYGFSHVLIPQAPAAAGFAEALTATLQLARAHGRGTGILQSQVVAALEALKRDQLRPGNDYLAIAPAQTWGGIRRSAVQSDIRIDFVQHAAAALAHGVSLGL